MSLVDPLYLLYSCILSGGFLFLFSSVHISSYYVQKFVMSSNYLLRLMFVQKGNFVLLRLATVYQILTIEYQHGYRNTLVIKKHI